MLDAGGMTMVLDQCCCTTLQTFWRRVPTLMQSVLSLPRTTCFVDDKACVACRLRASKKKTPSPVPGSCNCAAMTLLLCRHCQLAEMGMQPWSITQAALAASRLLLREYGGTWGLFDQTALSPGALSHRSCMRESVEGLLMSSCPVALPTYHKRADAHRRRLLDCIAYLRRYMYTCPPQPGITEIVVLDTSWAQATWAETRRRRRGHRGAGGGCRMSHMKLSREKNHDGHPISGRFQAQQNQSPWFSVFFFSLVQLSGRACLLAEVTGDTCRHWGQ